MHTKKSYGHINFLKILQTLCYISSSIANLTTKNLEQLFTITKSNNLKLKISGILIYNSGNFLQIIEGEKKTINALYHTISKDKNHNHLIKLIDKPITERMFEDYETGFAIIKDRKKQSQLEDYLNWLKNAEIKSIDKIITIIEKFVEQK